jgi:hypothetical protein
MATKKYESQVEATERYKEKLRANRMIPKIDETKERESREKYRYNLKAFCLEVMPHSFNLEFSESHDRVVQSMQEAILNGGWRCYAMPRGSGKTTLAIAAIIWAILFGHLRFGAIVASDQGAAAKLLSSIKTEIWQSDIIGKLWPQLFAYLEKGEGHGQKFIHVLNYDGTPPLIKWGTDMLKLPSVPVDDGHEWNGAVVQVRGITSGIRGMQLKLKTGETIRPDFLMVDDPQTRESSRSKTQTDQREEIIDGDAIGLAGPGKTIAAFMLCTVIEPNDLSERYLNRKIHGEWAGVKSAMVEQWPDALDTLWEEYKVLYVKATREERDTKEATDFYLANREAMDKGGRVYWEARKLPGDHSALQHAMNMRIRMKNAFLSEYQNEPIQRVAGKPYMIDEVMVMEKTNGLQRLTMPSEARLLVVMVDINYIGLTSVVLASTNDAVRYMIDCQKFPENGDLYDPSRNKHKESDAAAIARALDAHIPILAGKRYMRDGQMVAPDLVLIDCGNWMDLVFRWCAANGHKLATPRLYPSRGRADSKYQPSQLVGQPGDGWHVAEWKNRGRVLVHNSDLWRMRAQQAFIVPTSVPGSVSLYGKTPGEHKAFSDEVCAEILDEYQELTEGGNRFFKWSHRVGARNDKLDSLVGAMAGLSCLGASESGLGKLIGQAKVQKQPNRRVGRKVSQIRI